MVVIERGKYHTKERLANGKNQVTIGSSPINYHDGNAWNEIDSNWEAGDASFPDRITKAPFFVSTAPDGKRRIHPTRDPNVYFEIGAPYIKPAATWNKVNLGTRTRSGSRLTWTTANANMYIDFAGHFVKMAILLKGGYIPPNRQFAFPVDLVGMTRSGRNLLVNGQVVMVMQAPHVEDLDNPFDKRDIDIQFVNVSGQTYALFTLPQSLVTNPMSRPLIDPTLTLQPDGTAGIDARIIAGLATSNYGTSAIVSIGNILGLVCRQLIKFDLSSLPSAAVISSTTLSLYATDDFSSNTRTYRVFRLKRAWVEGTRDNVVDSPATGATWNRYDTTNNWSTAGGFHADDCEQTDIGSRSFSDTETLNQFKDFALTPTTKADLDLGNGWLIKADTELVDGYSFASSDNATAANRPKLVIVYTVAQSVDGTLTSAGDLLKQTAKSFVGTMTSIGTLFAQAQKVLAGTVTSAGTLLSQAQKLLSGLLTSDGTLTRFSNKVFSGAVALSGTLLGQTQKTLTGTLTSTGILLGQAQKALTGTIASIGTLQFSVQKFLSGTLMPVGMLIKQTQKLFVGILTIIGTLLHPPDKVLAGTLSFSGALITVHIPGIPGTVSASIVKTYLVEVEAQDIFLTSADSLEIFEHGSMVDERYAVSVDADSAFSVTIQELPI